ncbi:MAG: C4-dicarboxylate transporter DcuC [Sporomusaceae bacterium]|nr:C4-dicarboxylate transporter DcuC [Sporomusaceae bacterium]
MQIGLGIVIIAAMIYLMIKRYETKMVLFGAGMLMLIIAGDPMGAFVSFSKSMKQNNIFEVIIAAMGFAAVVQATGCDKHLIAVFIKILKRMGPFLIVGVALATTVVNSSIPSAAGVSAALGSILIPLLISSGIPAPIAAAAVMAGLYGGNLDPGHVHPTLVAELAGKSSVEFVKTVAAPLLSSVLASSFTLIFIAFWLKRRNGNAPVTAGLVAIEGMPENFKANYILAILPLLPLIILLLGNFKIVPQLKMPVSHAMMIGSLTALILTRSNPGRVTKAFFKGMGDSFGDIFGLIVAVNVFVAGMTKLGLIKTLLNFMISSPAIAKVAAVFGPFAMAILSGSGEAAAIAFNTAVSAHAEQFGMDVMHMGAMTVLSGGIGRSMSPVAGAMIICAGIAKVTPFDVVKYNAPAMLAALFVAALFLML